jgi:P4 family phage/plasmid primase-like protien
MSKKLLDFQVDAGLRYNIQSIVNSKKYRVENENIDDILHIFSWMAQQDDFHLAFYPKSSEYTQFRFDIDLSVNTTCPLDIQLYTEKQLLSTIAIINNVLNNFVDDIKDENLISAILVKSSYFLPEKQLYKNGVHIQYPYVFLKNSEIKGIVKEINLRIAKIYNTEYFKPDNGFINNAWLIYGANKRDETDKYKIHCFYNSKLEKVDFDTTTKSLIKLFWLFPYDNNNYCFDILPEIIEPTKNEEQDIGELDIDKSIEYLETMLYSLSKSRVENTSSWKAVICSVVSYAKYYDIDIDEVKTMLDEWSKSTNKNNYSEEGFNSTFDYALSPKNKFKYTSFITIYRRDNFKHNLFCNCDDLSVAELVKNLFEGMIYMKNDKEGWIYNIEKKIWSTADYYKIYDYVIDDVDEIGKQAIEKKKIEINIEKLRNNKSFMQEDEEEEDDEKEEEEEDDEESRLQEIKEIYCDADDSKKSQEENFEKSQEEINLKIHQLEEKKRIDIDELQTKYRKKITVIDDDEKLRTKLESKLQTEINTIEKESDRTLKEYMKAKEKNKRENESLIKKIIKDRDTQEQLIEKQYREKQRLRERLKREKQREIRDKKRLRDRLKKEQQREIKQKQRETKNEDLIISKLQQYRVYLRSVNFKKRLSIALSKFVLREDFGDILNSNQNLFPIKGNKVVDLTTGECFDRLQTHHFTFESDVEIVKDKTRAIKFFTDLAFGDNEISLYLQRLLLYCISGLTFDRSFYQLTGVGRNGKTTFINIISTLLTNDCSCKGSKSLVVKDQKHGNRHDGPNPSLLALKNKRCIFISETEHTDLLNASRIKELTGGDIIEARGLFEKKIVEFRNDAKIIIATNFPLQFHEVDNAVKDRYKYIQFKNTFENNSSINNEIKTNSTGFMSEIFSLCLENGKDYLQKENITCSSITKETEQLFTEMDSVQLFINESCCIENKEATISSRTLFDSYKVFCKNNSIEALSDKGFCKLMKTKGHEKCKDGKRGENYNKNVFKGITMLEENINFF